MACVSDVSTLEQHSADIADASMMLYDVVPMI
jgi:hypothetical protein